MHVSLEILHFFNGPGPGPKYTSRQTRNFIHAKEHIDITQIPIEG